MVDYLFQYNINFFVHNLITTDMHAAPVKLQADALMIILNLVKYSAASYGALPSLFLVCAPQRGRVYGLRSTTVGDEQLPLAAIAPRGSRHMDEQARPLGSLLTGINQHEKHYFLLTTPLQTADWRFYERRHH